MSKSAEVYAKVTEHIVRQIEEGLVSGTWRAPWHSTGDNVTGIPVNAKTGQPYSGGNIVALWIEQLARNLPGDTWATYKQWTELGAQVRKGEHGTPLIRWVVPKNKRDEASTEKDDKGRKLVPVGFTVFHSSQVDGWEPPAVTEATKIERIERAEAFFAAIGADVRHGGNRAYYASVQDYIQLPPPDSFEDAAYYYSTSAHEHVHWTGHASRLDRKLDANRFGDEKYAVEELVAELGSAFVCASLGIHSEPREDHVQYLRHWLTVLKADPKALYFAAGLASKASDHLVSLAEATERQEVAA